MTKLIAAFPNFANARKKDEIGSTYGRHGKDLKNIYKICDIILKWMMYSLLRNIAQQRLVFRRRFEATCGSHFQWPGVLVLK